MNEKKETTEWTPGKEGIYVKDGVLHVAGFEFIQRVAQALSGETRLRILKMIGETEMDVGQLSDKLKHSKANISSQIRKLEEAKLVESTYRPGKKGIKKVIRRNVKEIRIYLDLES
ncbi:MAG: ArsR family transcriptional regulator [Desulfurococcales archaeon]|nr:ArsR family transcriptional regulator [Desulfurococcales archaeon]